MALWASTLRYVTQLYKQKHCQMTLADLRHYCFIGAGWKFWLVNVRFWIKLCFPYFRKIFWLTYCDNNDIKICFFFIWSNWYKKRSDWYSYSTFLYALLNWLCSDTDVCMTWSGATVPRQVHSANHQHQSALSLVIVMFPAVDLTKVDFYCQWPCIKVTARCLWSSPPCDVISATALHGFQKCFKTYLFSVSFPSDAFLVNFRTLFNECSAFVTLCIVI